MFKTQSTAQRLLLKNRTSLVQQPMRKFQQYGSGAYKNGFERMVHDKLAWASLGTLSGMGFVFWGICNLGVYGLSKVMYKENFDYHFAYKGNGRLLKPLKSMMAGEDIKNVGWTSASLIIGGFYLQRRVGSMTSFKLFGLALTASYLATITLGPKSCFGGLNLRRLIPVRWDSIDDRTG